MLDALPFREIWAVDFEFGGGAGNRPDPVCLAAWELRSGRKLRLWRDEFGPSPPYSTGADALFLAYYASAEIGCHLALGWPKPARILDLFTEFRCRTNGLATPAGAGLVGALAYYGLDSMAASEKDAMRDAGLTRRPMVRTRTRGDPHLLRAGCRRPGAFASRLCCGTSICRGRFSAVDTWRPRRRWSTTACRSMRGCSICFERNGPYIQDQLITDIDIAYGVFDHRTFKADRFSAWLAKAEIPWPRLDSGKLDLSDDAFRQAARAHPSVAPLRELRSSLSELRLSDLAVGADGRNRCLLSAFRSRTGRNQPSNSKFIFGPSVWLRGLIKPPPGYGLAYVDWSQQEFGIAAALSGDPAMLDAYNSGDPYLAFAKQAGAVPAHATSARIMQSANNSRRACWLCSTAWDPRRSPPESGSRPSWGAS